MWHSSDILCFRSVAFAVPKQPLAEGNVKWDLKRRSWVLRDGAALFEGAAGAPGFTEVGCIGEGSCVLRCIPLPAMPLQIWQGGMAGPAGWGLPSSELQRQRTNKPPFLGARGRQEGDSQPGW